MQKVWFKWLSISCLLCVISCKNGSEVANRNDYKETGSHQLAQTPPMGWNSWDCAGIEITEKQVKAVADYMAENLKEYGWEYVVVDAGWFHPDTMKTRNWSMKNPPQNLDRYGRLLPDTIKFPSSRDGKGFKHLADYVHDKGLKFGIHVMRGIPWNAYKNSLPVKGTDVTALDIGDTTNVCDWAKVTYGIDMDKEGAQQYYNSLIELYSSWGVDYIKADDMARPYQAQEIEAISHAIQKIDPSIVLSLSPGAAPIEKADHLHEYAHLWRISADFWDVWEELYDQFERCDKWAPYVKPGGWPDADMLPLGLLRMNGTDSWVAKKLGDSTNIHKFKRQYSLFTEKEQYTLINLFSIFRSPLMYGGYLPENDSLSDVLITNPDVLYVNQHSTANRQIRRDDSMAVWAANDSKSEKGFVALFNLSDEAKTVSVSWEELSLADQAYSLTNLWTSEESEHKDELALELPAHGSFIGSINR